MATHQIPARATSRYSGQYTNATDPQRLIEIFSDSHRIALSSKNPDTAHERFELAVEAYHQLMSMNVTSDVRASVHSAMSSLADQFPAQVYVNEALGLREKAAKLKTALKKLELLQRAHQVLQKGLASNPGGSASIQTAAEQVRAEIAQAQAATT